MWDKWWCSSCAIEWTNYFINMYGGDDTYVVQIGCVRILKVTFGFNAGSFLLVFSWLSLEVTLYPQVIFKSLLPKSEISSFPSAVPFQLLLVSRNSYHLCMSGCTQQQVGGSPGVSVIPPGVTEWRTKNKTKRIIFIFHAAIAFVVNF